MFAVKQERPCMICGAREDTLTRGEVTLCRRCMTALYHALGAHFPLKPDGECDKMELSENKRKDR